jgi:hypothetical protein
MLWPAEHKTGFCPLHLSSQQVAQWESFKTFGTLAGSRTNLAGFSAFGEKLARRFRFWFGLLLLG